MARFGVRLRNMFILGFKQLQDPYYQGFAAQIAFYLLLSIVPIILLVTQILGVFDISIASALSLFESYTGHKIPTIILVIALWAGSRASFSIMRITNYTMTGGQSTGRNYFVERIRSIRTMIVTIITVVFAIVILVYGELILEMVLGLLKIDAAKYEDSIWMWLRWLIGFALYFLMISYNYYILPTEKVKFRQIIPGSIFASAGILVVTAFYAKYATSLADYDLLYGALSSVIAILIWFFLLAWVLLLGVLCNKVWADTKGGWTGYPDYYLRR